MERRTRSRQDRLDRDEAKVASKEAASDEEERRESSWADLEGDKWPISLLLFLYMLQGIPLGLTAAIPLVLSARHISYAQQAIFSFAYWPFSLKLLWAPIVDSVWSARIGRRKSWLVPTQYLIALFMYFLSTHVSTVLGDDSEHSVPAVATLTAIFFAFNFLAATQDIAVDGWALTMLSEKNLGYASTCNAVGQTAGYFLGNVLFLALESADFCNRYLRSGPPQPHGIVTLADFVWLWAWIFLASTTLVLLFKREEPERHPEHHDLSLKDSYRLLWRILRLKPVLLLVAVHLTNKIAFAAADGITGLKLVELGVPKDKMALLAIPLVPLQILLPWAIGKYTAGPRPFSVHLKAYPCRVLMGLAFAGVVAWTPAWQQTDGSFPKSYYALIVVVYCFQQVFLYAMFVAVMSFHAKISDPLVGGTYMTLLNTVSNLGGNWPVTLALSLVERLTWKECRSKDGSVLAACANEDACKEMGGAECVTTWDGYYALSIGCALVGLVWWLLMRRRVEELQSLPKQEWSPPKPSKKRS